MWGNTVVVIKMSDNTNRTETMNVDTTLSQGRLTHGPSTALSLHSSRRKTVALGSRIPARACTAVVMTPRGAPGMSTMVAARATIPVKVA